MNSTRKIDGVKKSIGNWRPYLGKGSSGRLQMRCEDEIRKHAVPPAARGKLTTERIGENWKRPIFKNGLSTRKA